MDIVIAAGGVGSRMSKKINPYNSKPLIMYNGKPLLFWIIKNAISVGFNNFFITANKQSYTKIKTIVDNFDINYKIKMTGINFASVPTLFIDDLTDRFLVVCGHDYILPHHFEKMLKESLKNRLVTTAYENVNNITENKRRIVFENNFYRSIDLEIINIPENHIYVRNPYIIDKKILCEVIKNNFEKTSGFYIFKRWESGTKVNHVMSLTSVEFDTDNEWFCFKKKLDLKNKIILKSR